MKRLLLLLFTLCLFNTVEAQEETETTDVPADGGLIDYDTYFIDHVTTMGERIIMISRKYMVDPDEIYKYNEIQMDKMGIAPGQTLKIPLHESHKKDLEKFKEQLIKKNGAILYKYLQCLRLRKKQKMKKKKRIISPLFLYKMLLVCVLYF